MLKKSLLKSSAAAALAFSLLTGGTAAGQSRNDLEFLSAPVNDPSAVSDKKGEVTKVHLRTQTGTESVSPATSLRNCFEQVRDAAITSKSKTTGLCTGPRTYSPNAAIGHFTCMPDAVIRAICTSNPV